MFGSAGAESRGSTINGCGAGLQPCRQSSAEGLPLACVTKPEFQVRVVEPELQFRAAIRAAAGASWMSGGCGVRSGTTL